MAPAFGAGIAAVIASRATAGLIGVGLVIVFFVSALREWTSRKAMIALAAAAALVVLGPLAVYSFTTRIELTYEGFKASDLERSALESAAKAMLADNPFGVGANNFALVAGNEGYARESSVLTNVLEFGVHVHNVYWLAAAETGYIGVLAFFALVLPPMFVAFTCAIRYRRNRWADLLLGSGVCLLMVCVHSLYEWVFVTYQIQYLFALVSGMAAASAERCGYWRSIVATRELTGRRRVKVS